ncbi:hypothetical protein ACWKW1_12125 [Brevibacillus parabrevis]
MLSPSAFFQRYPQEALFLQQNLSAQLAMGYMYDHGGVQPTLLLASLVSLASVFLCLLHAYVQREKRVLATKAS